MEPNIPYEILAPDNNLIDLLEFSKHLGVKLNPKVIYPAKFYPGYLGVLAIDDISPYEVILTAPNNSMLSMKLINSPELLEIYNKSPEDFAVGNGGENNRFIVYLLWELSKGINSKWYHYLNTLPPVIENLYDWTHEELKELQDEALLQYCIGKKEQDQECNKNLKEILEEFPTIISPEFSDKISWIWKVICTRAYGRCLPYLSLIPIADLFNHENVNTSYFYGKEDDLDEGITDPGNDDFDDPLPFKIVTITNFKLAKLAFTQNTKKSADLLEMAKAEDRKLFLASNS